MPNQWIPISQAPKECDERMLVFGLLEGSEAPDIYLAEGGLFVSQQGRVGRFIIDHGEDYDAGFATHFMFLPEPPNIEG